MGHGQPRGTPHARAPREKAGGCKIETGKDTASFKLSMPESEYISRVQSWLKCASSQISAEYFDMPVAKVGQATAIYRERVYCYELYHRWRQHWPKDFQYSLCGEVDKRSHSLIVAKHLKSSIPDFPVHLSGD